MAALAVSWLTLFWMGLSCLALARRWTLVSGSGQQYKVLAEEGRGTLIKFGEIRFQ